MFFNDEITIINHYKYNNQDKYKITPIRANFIESDAININNIKITKDDSVIIRILFSEKGYIEPKNFNINSNGWTLRKKDLIIPYKINETEIASIQELLDKYECYYIKKVKKNDKCSDSMKHWKVEAK